jgi:hypothetical protein
MDKEHKEELAHNDLMEFLTHFKQWWEKNGTSTLVIILLGVVAWIGINWYRTKDTKASEAAWTELARTRGEGGQASPAALEDVARGFADEPGLANYALLQAGDQLQYEAIHGWGESPGLPPQSVEPDEAGRKKLEQAIGFYQQVIDAPQAGDPPLAKLRARLGMASCHESLRQWEKAREQYQLATQESGSLKHIADLAQQRLGELDGLAGESILFRPAPPEPAEQGDAEADVGDEPGAALDASADAGGADPDSP